MSELMEGISIDRKELKEFEYEEFSVFFDPVENFWFLETYDDEDEVERVVIENSEGMNYSINSEFFSKIGFTEENFVNLKNFVMELEK